MSDVAELAGVSAITVSRVINRPEKVSAVVKQKVFSAIDSLGYIPNHSASALASSRSGVIGVVIPSLSNSVFNDVLKGIYEVTGPTGYHVVLADSHYSPLEEERMVRTLLGQSPEAMIITGGNQTELTRNMLLGAGIPIVQIMESVDEPIDMNVGFSHREAAFEVVSKIVAAGYTKLGFLGARMDSRAQQRLQGYRNAMEAQGLFNDDWVMTTPRPSSIAMGGELFTSLMAKSEGECNAVFCVNDDLALGTLFECQRMYISVPDKMAICGFNDIEASALVNPPLSSVRVPRYDMGVTAAQMALRVLSDDDNSAAEQHNKIVDSGYQIMMRESTGYKK
ncbi:LacI family DNA-binding transcriptional regulator [Teredinibacter purpureus]|uniref:LacI family DNA-binding transcriptional regulator n=1 Tax=Teredinibacter purpureus TaxID=2731756 RepID=UPI0005F83D7B|nr:LacI family DNA-binding transcriptional regulator [Teredinibacter purpureus]